MITTIRGLDMLSSPPRVRLYWPTSGATVEGTFDRARSTVSSDGKVYKVSGSKWTCGSRWDGREVEVDASADSSLDLGSLILSIDNGGSLWIGAARVELSIDGGKIRARIQAPKAIPIIRDGSSLASEFIRDDGSHFVDSPISIPDGLDRNLVGPWILERQDYERYQDSDETSWVREGLPSAELAPLAQEVALDPNLRAINLLSGEVACWHESPEAPKPEGFVRHAVCKDCEGTGELLCWQCDGAGEECRSREEEVLGGRVCPRCDGNGSDPCRSCAGSGRVPLDALGAPLT